MPELPDDFWTKMEECYKAEDEGDPKPFNAERPTLKAALEAIAAELSPSYEFVRPIGRGGAGVVIEVKDNHLHLSRALKVPRPRQDALIDSVRNESDHLMQLHHDHIIRLYTLGDCRIPDYAQPYPYFVMEYIEGVTDVRKQLESRLRGISRPDDLRDVTRWLALKLSAIADALQFLHSHDTIHFDVKPANILIAPDGKPILTDLGFAKRKQADDAGEVMVGFTLFYAHPDLGRAYQNMSSQNRVRKPERPRDFKTAWDIHAFGKSLLELLCIIDHYLPDAVPYDYGFVYLHLAACRMLDGHNQTINETTRIREPQIRDNERVSVYREVCLNLSTSDFSSIAYKSFDMIAHDLGALVHQQQISQAVPELDPFQTERVQTSSGVPAAFTARVKAIVEHPCFARLATVPQLGLTSTVFPGATHTRMEHSLGAFQHCCEYLCALYNDPYSPLFRQLMAPADIRCAMLASLLHDIGQFPLAHELEEVSPSLKHERMTLAWLDNPTEDQDGRTLKQIILDPKFGWDVSIEALKSVLAGPSRDSVLFPSYDLKVLVLASIIDGPLDVDKLDYLIRDSENAFLPYGRLIDVDRLVRNLTVLVTKDDKGNTMCSVGTYEKGQSAAESMTFARYLMYQALYWHRTSRSLRAMLREAVRRISENQKKAKKKSAQTFEEAILALLGIKSSPRAITVSEVLDTIEKATDETGRQLIEQIRRRRYYKRILTVHSHRQEEGRRSLLERMRDATAVPGFDEALQRRLRARLARHIAQVHGPEASALAPQRAERVLSLLDEPGRVLCDCPRPNPGSEDKLRFMPEPQRLLRNYFSRVDVSERVSEVWQQVFFKLMEIASKGRVFCSPDIRDTLMAAMGPDDIEEELITVLADFGR